jgi:hypothetical protein
MKATFIKRIVDRVPENPSLSFNGGDYYFHRDIYRLNDGREFSIMGTSSEFDFCQVSGSFTETWPAQLILDDEAIEVEGKPLYVWAAKWLANQGVVSPHIISED